MKQLTCCPLIDAPKACPRGGDAEAGVEAWAVELIAAELSLQELHKAMRLTRAELAKRLGVRQDTIARAERIGDMLLPA